MSCSRPNHVKKKISYSNNFRQMIMLINPYNLSCSYKPMFEDHCRRVLIECDERLNVFDSPHGISSNTCMVKNTSEDINGISEDVIPSKASNALLNEQVHFSPLNEEDVSQLIINEDTVVESSHCSLFLGKLLALRNANKKAVDKKSELAFTDRSFHGEHVCLHSELAFKASEDDDLEITALSTTSPTTNSEDINNNTHEHPIYYPTVAEYYSRIALTPTPTDASLSGWEVCFRRHVADLDATLLQPGSASDPVCSNPSPRHSSVRRAANERIPFGLSPFCRLPILESAPLARGIASDGRSTHTAEGSACAVRPLWRSGEKTRLVRDTGQKVKLKKGGTTATALSKDKVKDYSQQKLRHQPSIYAPIQYGFQHHNTHRSHIQHYRNDYTHKKLEHVVLQVAQRQKSAGRDSLVPVARGAVEYSDVRKGAFLQCKRTPLAMRTCTLKETSVSHGQEVKIGPIKLIEYRFESESESKRALSARGRRNREHVFFSNSDRAVQPEDVEVAFCETSSLNEGELYNMRVNSKHTCFERAKKHINTYSISGDRFSANAPTNSSTCPKHAETHPPHSCASCQPLPSSCSAPPHTLSTPPPIASGTRALGRRLASTSVCRSRPSIPSNARGVVCASSLETPLHVVNMPVVGQKSKQRL